MGGGHDPLNRAPMNWDLLETGNEELEQVRQLVRLREQNPALIAGDFRKLDSMEFVAFLRQTGNPRETVIVAINASNQDKRDVIPVRDSLLMDAQKLICLHSQTTEQMHSGCLKITLPAVSARIFRTSDQGANRAYTAFKRVV
jgi:pullulanase/glycogen debranching enzyme